MKHLVYVLTVIVICLLLFPSDPLSANDMVMIPAGEFFMGSTAAEGGLPDEQPLRRVHLSAFYIDRYEITNQDYERFVRDVGHRPPAHATPASTLWEGTIPMPGIERHPVINV
ncbi:MAG TPA: SUMF1/EgtB/PvdO family nonheme iron enzyme, partial [Nitrospiraceae bacterium]|nr:SUMF1/EgtB/PvdO family nonheme iron enzyme [Nitrospiraceae bacterium]